MADIKFGSESFPNVALDPGQESSLHQQFDGNEDKEIRTCSSSIHPSDMMENSFQVHLDNQETSQLCDNMDTAFTEAGQTIKMMLATWNQSFNESQDFENFYPARLDEMIREAKCIEEKLRSQKEQLKKRLTIISRALTSPNSDL